MQTESTQYLLPPIQSPLSVSTSLWFPFRRQRVRWYQHPAVIPVPAGEKSQRAGPAVVSVDVRAAGQRFSPQRDG